MVSVPPISWPVSSSILTSWGTGEELVKFTVSLPALAVMSPVVKERLPLGSASTSMLAPDPALPPSASCLAPSAFSSASSPTSSAVSPASSAFSSASWATPAAAPVSLVVSEPPPHATSASAASSRANRTMSFFIFFLSREGRFALTLVAPCSDPLPRSAAVELRSAAAEEGLDPVAQVLGPHRVGDPVALQLQVLGDAVVEADAAEPFRHSHVVGRLPGQFPGLRPGRLHQLP